MCGSEVTSAQVDGDGHVLGCVLDSGVDQGSVLSWESIKVLATSSSSLAHVQVAKVGKIGIVELDISASSFAECLDLSSVGGCQILEEVVHVWVGSDVDGSSASSEVGLLQANVFISQC